MVLFRQCKTEYRFADVAYTEMLKKGDIDVDPEV